MLGKLALPGGSILFSQPKSVSLNPKIKRLYTDLSHKFLTGMYFAHTLLFCVQSKTHKSINNLLIVSLLPLMTIQVQSNSGNTVFGAFSFITLLPTSIHWQENLVIFQLIWAERQRYTVVPPLLVFCSSVNNFLSEGHSFVLQQTFGVLLNWRYRLVGHICESWFDVWGQVCACFLIVNIRVGY